MSFSYQKLPNFLTIVRILLTPVVIFCLYYETDFLNNIAVIFFIIASITDYFDGYLARKYELKSTFGQLMDPIADKVLVNSVLIMLTSLGQVNVLIVITFIIRDTFVQGVRTCAAIENLVIEAVTIGKWKTALQITGLVAIIVKVPSAALSLYEIGYGLLCLSVILSLISGYQYCHHYYQHCLSKT